MGLDEFLDSQEGIELTFLNESVEKADIKKRCDFHNGSKKQITMCRIAMENLIESLQSALKEWDKKEANHKEKA